MKQEAKKTWYYYVFDEVTGVIYEAGWWEWTRADAFEWIQNMHYFYLDAFRKAGKKTRADQLRSIIKDDPEAALREYKRMTGREER